jgi:hypothetical protein
MCIIWSRPAGASAITPEHLNEALLRNGDGFGWMAFIDGKVVTRKFGPTGRDAFVASYREAEATGAAIVGHARIGTHGPRTVENAHPFRVVPEDGSEPYYLAHNGILSISVAKDASDTLTYCEQVLARLPGRWWENPALFYLVASDLGYTNKFAIMAADGEVILVNERAGTRDGDIWFSNTSFRPWPVITPVVPKVHMSNRERKRQQRAAAKAEKAQKAWVIPATTSEDAFLPDRVVTPAALGTIEHVGHQVAVVKPVSKQGPDATIRRAYRCVPCATWGDAFRIDNSIYVDLDHRADMLEATAAQMDALYAPVPA